jgi:hypothetical protein
LNKGFLWQAKTYTKVATFWGKKRLEVAVFTQCVHHVSRQNYAGFPKHLQFCDLLKWW